MQQSLTVLGQPYFVANIQSATDGAAVIGSAAVPFSNIYVTQSNVGTANLNTTITIPSAQYSGNLLASNAFQATNVTASTSNITLAATTTAILTTVGTGSALPISGNVYTGSMKTTNVLSPVGNLDLVNTITTTTGTVGNTGAAVGVSGNLYVSNALTTTNIFVTAVNIAPPSVGFVSLANIASVTTGQVLINGANPDSSFSVFGNVQVSNSITTSNAYGGFPVMVAYANVPSLPNLNATGIPMSNAWTYVPFSGSTTAELSTDAFGNLTWLAGSMTGYTSGGPGNGPYASPSSNVVWTVKPGLDLAENVSGLSPPTEPFVISFWFKLLANPALITTQSTIVSAVSASGDQFNLIITSGGLFNVEWYNATDGWQTWPYGSGKPQTNTMWQFMCLWWTGNAWMAWLDGVSFGMDTPLIYTPSSLTNIVFGSRFDGSNKISTMLPYGISDLRIFKSLSSKFFDINWWGSYAVNNYKLPQLDARSSYENRVYGNVYASNAIVISNTVTTFSMQASTVNTASISSLSISFPQPWILVNFDSSAQDTGIGGIVGLTYTWNGALSWRKSGPGGAPSMYLEYSGSSVYLSWTLSRWARQLGYYNWIPFNNEDNGMTISIWVKFRGAEPYPGEVKFPTLFSIGVRGFDGVMGALGVVLYRSQGMGAPPQIALLQYVYSWNYGITPDLNYDSPNLVPTAPDTWYHVAIVQSVVNSTFQLYINGILQTEIGNAFNDNLGYISDSMHIGRIPDGNSIFAATGLTYIETSRLAVFNRQFTDSEVLALVRLNAGKVENQVVTDYDFPRAITASNAIAASSIVSYGSMGATTMNVDSIPTMNFNMLLDPVINFDFDGRTTSSVDNPYVDSGSIRRCTYNKTGGPGGGPSIYLPGHGDPYVSAVAGTVAWSSFNLFPVFSSGFSISFWFKWTPNTNQTTPSLFDILLQWNGALGGDWQTADFGFYLDSTNGILYFQVPGQSMYASNGAWKRGEWNHVVLTSFPTGIISHVQSLFVNGSFEVSQAVYPWNIGGGGSTLALGESSDNIEYADLKFFQRPLTSTEVTKLYNMKGLGNQTKVFGNLNASNALTSSNLFTQRANLNTLNVSSVTKLAVNVPPNPLWWMPMTTSANEVNGLLTGDLQGSVTFIEDSPIRGRVALFDGASFQQYTQGYTTSSPLTSDAGYTIAFWFKTPGPLNGPGPVLFDFYSYLSYLYFDSNFFQFYHGTSGVSYWASVGGTNTQIRPQANTWYHVVMFLAAGGGLAAQYQSLWINGVETTTTGLYYPDATDVYLNYLRAGNYYSPLELSDLRIYNRPLTSAEIISIYQWRASPHTAPVRGNLYVSNTLSSTSVLSLSTSNVPGTLNVNSITTSQPLNPISSLMTQLDFAGTYSDKTGNVAYSSGSGTFAMTGPIGGPALTAPSGLYYTMPTSFIPVCSGCSISFWFKNNGAFNFCLLDATYFVTPSIRFDASTPGQLTISMFYDPYGGYFVIPSIFATFPTDPGWHHVCLTINPTDPFLPGVDPSASLYVDGNFVTTSTGTGHASYLIGTFLEGNLYFTSADVASFKLFSKALSQAEITALASPGIAIPSNLGVYGNISVANSISSGTLLTSNMNSSTLNTASWSPATFSFTNIAVQNNLTTVNANVTTLNTASVAAGTLFVPTASITGNLVTLNAISTNNLFASGTLTYNEDLTKRAVHLRPSQANSAAIQGWIGATCNAASQPVGSYWSVNQSPDYGNVVSFATGQAFFGGVLVPDGRVMFVPCFGANVGMFNIFNSSLSLISYPCYNGTQMFKGGVLLPNGNVVCAPLNSANAGMFNPLTYAWSNIGPISGQGGGLCVGGVLAPNGNVVCVPYNSANVIEINPNLNPPTIANTLVVQGPGLSGFQGGVLLPNGNVVFTPFNSANIGVYNPLTSPPTFTNVGPISGPSAQQFIGGALAPNGNVVFGGITSLNIGVYNSSFVSYPIASGGYSNVACGGVNFQGAVTMPTGNIVMVPGTTANVGMFDPTRMVYSNSTTIPVSDKFRGGTLLPSGQIVFTPFNSPNVVVLDTMTPAPPEFCLSPYVNKF